MLKLALTAKSSEETGLGTSGCLKVLIKLFFAISYDNIALAVVYSIP